MRWLTDPQVVVYVIEVESDDMTDEVVRGDERTDAAGLITFEEESDPDYRSVALDISLFARFVGKGLGPEALRTLLRYLFTERGHHRATIDPAVGNDRAIHAYRKVGFKPVGVLRRYERAADGSWRDALLMDILAEELEHES